MLEVVLDVVFTVVAIRAIWKLLHGVMVGMSGGERGRSSQSPSASPPAHGVQMARDPICGTYVVPERALSIRDAHGLVYFCSDACRDRYRAKSA